MRRWRRQGSLSTSKSVSLKNKVVSAGQSKQDFHAKFYAGISDDWCEVYSGSANLLRGPSMENTSFRSMTRETFNRRYLARMALKKPLPVSEYKANERSLVMYGSGSGNWPYVKELEQRWIKVSFGNAA